MARHLDFDIATEEAFGWFTDLLEERLDALELDHELVIRRLAGHRSQKLMRLAKTRSGLTVWALDNTSLPKDRAITRAGMAALRGLGFQRWRNVPGYYLAHFAPGLHQRAADHVVEALRRAYQVLHPALLAEPLVPTQAIRADEAPEVPDHLTDEVEVVDVHHLVDLLSLVFRARGGTATRGDGRVQGSWRGVEVCATAQGLDTVVLSAVLHLEMDDPARFDALLTRECAGCGEHGMDNPVGGVFDVVRDGPTVSLEATLHAQPFHGDFFADMLDDLVAEYPHVERVIAALLNPGALNPEASAGLDE
ncbi:TY-Chap domain-containing protein [Aestuariimicrobium soli]|uniref:TY-Chap domain-containing protein n=1 Tax=Aestuariimicrobium soli TaxID=2035834 RepID=UPI003EBE9EAC